jgi:hypothetical protein
MVQKGRDVYYIPQVNPNYVSLEERRYLRISSGLRQSCSIFAWKHQVNFSDRVNERSKEKARREKNGYNYDEAPQREPLLKSLGGVAESEPLTFRRKVSTANERIRSAVLALGDMRLDFSKKCSDTKSSFSTIRKHIGFWAPSQSLKRLLRSLWILSKAAHMNNSVRRPSHSSPTQHPRKHLPAQEVGRSPNLATSFAFTKVEEASKRLPT